MRFPWNTLLLSFHLYNIIMTITALISNLKEKEVKQILCPESLVSSCICILDVIKVSLYKMVTEEGEVKKDIVETRIATSWQLLKLDDEYYSIFSCVVIFHNKWYKILLVNLKNSSKYKIKKHSILAVHPLKLNFNLKECT